MNRLPVVLTVAALLTCASTARAVAPVNYRLVGPTPATYAPLVGGTPIDWFSSGTGEAEDNVVDVPLPVPLAFEFFGNAVTDVYVGTDGFITFDRQYLTGCEFSCNFIESGLPLDPSATGEPSALDAVYIWNISVDASQSPAQIVTGMETVGDEQVFTIDYQNVVDADSEGSGPFTSFSAKVRLYPAGSQIEVVYGAIVNPGIGFEQTSTVLGVQNDVSGPTALWVAGLPCASAPGFFMNCADSDYPANESFLYQYANNAQLGWGFAQLTSVEAGPDAGDPVTVSVTAQLQNTGTADAGAFDVALYFSSNPTFDSTAVALDTLSISGLGLGGSEDVVLTGTFPRPAPGKYYLLVYADSPTPAFPNGEVQQITTANDITTLVLYMGTDLTGTISAPDAGGFTVPIPVTISVFNQGVDPPTKPFDYGIYLSANPDLDGGATLVYSGTIDPDGGLPLSSTLFIPLPAVLPADALYWILSIDSTDQIVEVDKTNNVVVTPNAMAVVLPDLAVTDVEVRDINTPNPDLTTAFFGQPVQVHVVVTNVGQAPVGSFDTGIFIAGGLGASEISILDQELADPSTPSLAAGASVTLNLTITIPVNSNAVDGQGNPIPWTPGTFYLGAIANALGAFTEVTLTNNIGKYGPLQLEAPAPDFAPVEIDVPAAGAVGEVLPVFRVIRNLGNLGNTDRGAQPCPYQYYLSANDIITTEGIPLQILANGVLYDEGGVELGVGADSRVTDLVQIPGDVTPGTYYLGILVNPNETVPEIDYANDSLASSSTVSIAASTLVVLTGQLPGGVVGLPYDVTLGAAGGVGGYTWTVDPSTTLPPGLTLSRTGNLSGTPTQAGTGTLVVAVSSGTLTTRALLVLQINALSSPLTVLTQNLPTAVAGQTYSAGLAAIGGSPPYLWSLVAGSAPPAGLTLVPDGGNTIAGTLQADAVTGTFGVTVADALGTTSSRPVTLRVVSSTSLRITTASLPSGVVGQNYPPAGGNNAVVVVNASGALTFAIVAGSLPPGLTQLTATDRLELQGQPTQPGLYAFTVQATDASGQQDEHDYAIAVQGSTLSLTPVPLPAVKPGAAYDSDLSSIAARATWVLYSGALPLGITLDAAGHLGGTCSAKASPGTYSFIAQATDPSGNSGVVAESIVVSAPAKAIPKASGGCASSGGGLGLLALAALLGLRGRRRSPIVALTVAGLALPCVAGAQTYTESTQTVSYTALTGDTALNTGSGIGEASPVSLPFTFTFFGQPYTSISVGTSGYLTFTGTADSVTPSLTGQPAIAAWWDDLDMSEGEVSYLVTGTSPHQVLTVEWSNANNVEDEEGFFSAFTEFNFQIALHQTGEVDLIYGGEGDQGEFSDATAGISNGSTTTLFALACGSTCAQTSWPSGEEVTFVSGPELTLTNLAAPGLVYSGSSVTATAVASNLGGQSVASTSVRFWLSSTQAFDPTADAVLGNVTGLALPAGTSQNVSLPFNVGARTAGTYYLFAEIDPDNLIAELDGGSTLAGPALLDVANPEPDLTVPSATASSHANAPGDTVTLSFTVLNQGSVASASVSYAVYLSTSSSVSVSDPSLVQGTVPALAAGATSMLSAMATLPSTLAPGQYYLGVVVDPLDAQGETNKLNNAGTDPTPIDVSTSTITVLGPPSGTLPPTTQGAVYGYQFAGGGGDGLYGFTASGALPPGLELSSTGELTGRPAQAQASPYSLIIGVHDTAGHSATGTFSLLVTASQAPLTLLTTELVEGTFAQPYTATLSALGGMPPYTWALSGTGRLPTGVALGATGTLSGTPQESGTFPFQVQVTDSSATPQTATMAETLTIVSPALLSVSNPMLPGATLDQPYQVVLSVAGGTPAYNYSVPYCPMGSPCVTRFPEVPTDPIPSATGTLPAGLYFSCIAGSQGGLPQAVITSNPPNRAPNPDAGINPCFYDPTLPANAPAAPQEAGTFAIPARITDAAGNQVLVTYALTVGFGQGITLVTQQLPDALSAATYSFQIQAVSPMSPKATANDPTSGPALSWSIACGEQDSSGKPLNPCPEGLPTGITLSAMGLLSGKLGAVAAAKTYTFLVRVADAENRVAVGALSLTTRPGATTTASSGCSSTEGGSALAILALIGAGSSRRRRGRAGLALKAAALGVVLAGCANSSPAPTRCTGVLCTGNTVCDLYDGQCKCGGAGGVVCAAGETCDTSTKTCSNPSIDCSTVTCSGDTTCDPTDGLCKCGGAGGAICDGGAVCDPTSRACVAAAGCSSSSCPANETCDAATGACACAGAVCGAGQACAPNDGGCVASACSGVHCVGSMACDSVDGQCKCNGALCGAGQACGCPADGGCAATALFCSASTLCSNVICLDQLTCDPADGLCKCGGPGGVICGAGQACSLPEPYCVGSNRCENITCPTGSSCDPEDGQCKCGGVGGAVCASTESCFQLPNGYACKVACDPWNPANQVCPSGTGCYFNTLASLGTGYCEVPASNKTDSPAADAGGEPPSCNSFNDCEPSYLCLPFGETAYPGFCHRLCLINEGASGCAGPQSCATAAGPPPSTNDGMCCPTDSNVLNACD